MAGAVQSFHIHCNPDCGGSISLNVHLFTGPWLSISRVKWKFWPQRTQSDISRVKCKGVKLPSFVIPRLLLSCRTRQAVCWLNLAFLRGNILKGKIIILMGTMLRFAAVASLSSAADKQVLKQSALETPSDCWIWLHITKRYIKWR